MKEFFPESGIKIVNRKFTSLLGGVQEIGKLKENDLLKNLVHVFGQLLKLNTYFDGKWVFTFTGAHPSIQDSFLKPDISITRSQPPNEKCDFFSTTEVVVEGKCIPQDIFRDRADIDAHPEIPFAKDDDASVLESGQLTSAVRHIFLHQHRSSVFSVFLSQERGLSIPIGQLLPSQIASNGGLKKVFDHS
jgi:hypothetical protein